MVSKFKDLKKELIQHDCLRCGYSWLSKCKKPRVCSTCKNWRWNIPTEKKWARSEKYRAREVS